MTGSTKPAASLASVAFWRRRRSGRRSGRHGFVARMIAGHVFVHRPEIDDAFGLVLLLDPGILSFLGGLVGGLVHGR